jgi:hypothetical protein
MIREYEVVEPPNQRELMNRINAAKAGGAILDLVVRPAGDELSTRRATKAGIETEGFSMSVDSIHDINGDPYVLGFAAEDETTMARLEVTPTGQPDVGERPLNLIVISRD